jgi:hypothetical protein
MDSLDEGHHHQNTRTTNLEEAKSTKKIIHSWRWTVCCREAKITKQIFLLHGGVVEEIFFQILKSMEMTYIGWVVHQG